MTAVLERYRCLLAVVATVEQVIVVLLILNIIVNIGAQVFSRYLLGEPLIWVEELATYSFVWATFLGASLGLKHGRHIKIETFVDRLPRAGGYLLKSVVYATMLAICLLLLRECWTVMGIESRRNSISLPVELPISLFFSIPLFVGLTSMAVTLVYLIAAELRTLSGAPAPPPIIRPLVDEAQSDTQRHDQG